MTPAWELLTADQAIAVSIRETRIVRIVGCLPGTGDTLRARAADSTSYPADDGRDVDHDVVHEFWGGEAPNEWRVHVLVEAGAVVP